MNTRHISVNVSCVHDETIVILLAALELILWLSERTGVSKEVKKALSELVQERPRDPLSHLARQYPRHIAQLAMSVRYCA